MDRRRVSAFVAALVAISLVGAPLTMADWSEQATFSADPVQASDVREETPVLRYETLPPNAQDAVRHAVESAGGHHTVYGSDDWPDRFFYSDYSAPGEGTYAIVYEDQYYRLTTYAGGGFPIVYWLYELPFVAYGVVLGRVAHRTYRGVRSSRAAVLAAVPGIAFHSLGPEFDFPLLAPTQFVGLGALAAGTVVIALVWSAVRERAGAVAE